MNTSDFEFLRNLLKQKSGLIVTPDKAYLLESRLIPVARKWNYPDISMMVVSMRGLPDQKLVKEVVEAMTTNETSFFRDMKPFERFEKTMLPYLMQSRAATKRLRIWCAAASSGQEPYTLAMMLKEKGLIAAGWKVEIIGTDIDTEILAKARQGEYSQFEVQRGLPITYLMKYFTQVGDRWQLKDDIRNMVTYQPLNLLESLASVGQYDAIFCRNVLIYFDNDTKKDVLDRMSRQCSRDGFLVLGGAETVLGITDSFVSVPNERGIYALPGSVHLQAAA